MKGIVEYLIRVTLLCAILLIGAGLVVLGNLSDASADEAAVARAVKDYQYEVEIPVIHPRDPLSFPETMHLIGGWGCFWRGTFPHSILGEDQCF